ncbi:SRPBCC family protein [Marivita sp.]|jgi:uncharacterized protein YndB with AHSA1/START domain|uniref:SRPBCC family protein n=1 Tax=Marivita sp. TaxID=2003365 RepID=UPI003F6CAD3D
MTFNPDTDLKIERLINAAPETIWRCWAEPALFKQWFVPHPVEVTEVENDLRPGGRAFNVMKLPDGTLMENDGCFLLADRYTRLVFTDGVLSGFRPSPTPAFMTADIHLIPQDRGTLYAAHVMHSDSKKRDEHEKMGFFDGWGTTLEQLAALAQRL